MVQTGGQIIDWLLANLTLLEFMFMKHNAPNRCEPSIGIIVKWVSDRRKGGWLVARLGVWGGVGVNAKKRGGRLGSGEM